MTEARKTQETRGRHTQRAALLAKFIAAKGCWVPLPEILALGIAQYGARIHELRRLGFRIENRRARADGVLHTFFRLNGGAAITPQKQEHSAEPDRLAQAHKWIAGVRTEPESECGSLFGDLAPDRTYRE